MATGNFVAYYRVSTSKQGRSGLGLDAQRQSVEAYLDGGSWRVVAEFVEVESGKKSDRPELAKALAACRLHGATLVVAKLDRLTRNAGFWFALREAGVRVVCVDLPDAGDFVVGIMALVAEYEGKLISQRTKDALAQAKRRGVKLGKPENRTAEGTRRGVERGREVRTAKADEQASDVMTFLAPMVARGASLRDMVRELEAHRIPAPSRKPDAKWTPTAVRRVILRAG
jgi:DNA invertase Pin-like site-specific DNA recombinase